jgi:dTDP-4-dehydrorhamnose 3,5-epimerase
MPVIKESAVIAGVLIVELKAYRDERGRFMETFRKDWFPQRPWAQIQSNLSQSKAGVVRGLHYHFRQVDYWFVVDGTIRAALVDVRPNSATFHATQTIVMGGEDETGLFIPVGVAHGFAALTDVTLMYHVDNYYDSHDEFGIAWDDPDLAIEWGVDSPVVSPRDAENPQLRDVPMTKLPYLANES